MRRSRAPASSKQGTAAVLQSQAKQVDKYLDSLRLYTNAKTGDQEDVMRARRVLGYIREVLFVPDMAKEEQALCVQSVMGREPSRKRTVVQRLAVIRLVKEYRSFREDVCALVVDCLDHFPQDMVRPYAPYIQTLMISLIRTDPSNKVRDKAFAPLLRVMERELVDDTHEGREGFSPKKLISLLDYELRNASSKTSQTVLGRLLSSLGLLADLYPGALRSSQVSAEALAQRYTKMLEREFDANNEKDMRRQVVAGAFSGLTRFLNEFSGMVPLSPPARNSSHSLGHVYRHMSMVLELFCTKRDADDPTSGALEMRYDLVRAALELMAKHAALFRPYLSKDCANVLRRVLETTVSKNTSVRDLGLECLEAVVTQFSADICESPANKRCRSNFKHLVRTLQSLTQPDPLRPELSVLRAIMAVRGYGQVAPAIKAVTGEGDLQEHLRRLVTMSERVYKDNKAGSDTNDFVRQFPAFVSAYALIIKELSEVPTGVVFFLERLMAVFFRLWPSIYTKNRKTTIDSVLRLLVVLHGQGALLQQLLDKIMYGALIRTVQTLPENLDASGNRSMEVFMRRCYEEYNTLWKSLLSPPEDSAWNHGLNASPGKLTETQHLVYDQLLDTIRRMLARLNLGYTDQSEQGHGEGGVAAAGTPHSLTQSELETGVTQESRFHLEVPQDFNYFLHLTHFCQSFLPSCRDSWFLPWALSLGEDLIKLANKHVLISGFYKLLQVVMSLCDKHCFFDAPSGVRDDDSVFFGKIFTRFVDTVVVRAQQFKDELLFSCLSLLLSVPLTFVHVSRFVPVLEHAFAMGVSHIPAAELAMSTLERWLEAKPEQLQPHFSNILPLLSPYLLPSGGSSLDAGLQREEKGEEEEEEEFLESGSQDVDGEAERPGEDVDATPASSQQSLDSKKLGLSIRVLRFLGGIGGRSRCMVESDDKPSQQTRESDEGHDETLAWDPTPRVRYRFPFPGNELSLFSVHLDPLLPRVCHLAVHSPVRRTKVAACELLHSLVVHMVAMNATRPQSASQHSKTTHSRTKFTKVYNHIFPVLLRLAVDVENVARQLFRPLVLQLIHWFTGNITAEHDETMVLLDALIDAIGHQEQMSLREFGSECLAEFIEWSLRQYKKRVRSTAVHLVNVVSLLNRLYSLALHPSPFKRSGAAFALSRLYRILREHTFLVSAHTLNVLDHMLRSLHMAERMKDAAELGTREDARRVIEHFTKIVTYNKQECWKLLLKTDRSRQGAEHCLKLPVFVEWLRQQLGSTSDDYRRQCQTVLGSFVLFVAKDGGAEAVADWLNDDNKTPLVRVIEHGTETDAGDVEPPGKSHRKEGVVMAVWLRRVAAALDSYTWLLMKSKAEAATITYSTPEELFDNAAEPSFLFDALQVFVAELCKPELDWVLPDDMDTALELTTTLRTLRTTVTVRVMRFLQTMLTHQEQYPRTRELLCESLYEFLFRTLLSPSSVGHAVDQPERVADIQKQVAQLLQTLFSKMGEGVKRDLVSALHAFLRKDTQVGYDAWNTAGMLRQCGTSSILLRGLLMLWHGGVLKATLGGNAESAGLRLVHEVADTLCSRAISPLEKGVGGKLLYLGLSMGVPMGTILTRLSDLTPVVLYDVLRDEDEDEDAGGDGDLDMGEDSDEEMRELMQEAKADAGTSDTRGDVLYRHFQKYFDRHFLKHFKEFSAVILKEIGPSSSNRESRQLFMILTQVLDHCTRLAEEDKKDVQGLITSVFRHLASMDVFDDAPDDLMRLKLDLTSKMFQLAPGLAFRDGDAKEALVEAYCAALSCESVSLRASALELLPRFLGLPRPEVSLHGGSDKDDSVDVFAAVPDDVLQRVLRSLGSMCTSYPFPTRSTDLTRGSDAWKDYALLMTRLLDALVVSQSFALLRTLLPVLREQEHQFSGKITQSLQQLVTRLTQWTMSGHCGAFLDQCVAAFYDEGLDRSLADNARCWLVERCLTRCLSSSTLPVTQSFFERHSSRLLNYLTGHDAASLSLMDGHRRAIRVMELTCVYRLFTVKYTYLGKEIVTSTGVDYKKMLKCANDHVHKLKYHDQAVFRAVYDLRAHAYNFMIACIKCTQSQLKIFTMFLFPDKKNLWEAIVDPGQQLRFTIDTNFRSVSRSFRRLRKERPKLAASHLEGAYAPLPEGMRPSVTQDVGSMSSFLGDKPDMEFYSFQDVANYRALQQRGSVSVDEKEEETDQKESQDLLSGVGMREEDDDSTGVGVQQEEDEGDKVEVDPVASSFPSFLPLLDVVAHMHSRFAGEWSRGSGPMPSFLRNMRNKLVDKDTSDNVKWFIVKLVLLNDSVFSAHAKEFFVPLVHVVLSTAHDPTKTGFHYMLRDLCMLLLRKWEHFVPQGDSDLSNRFVEHLMSVAADIGNGLQQRRKLMDNLNMIKFLVEKWQTRLNPSKFHICQLLAGHQEADEKRESVKSKWMRVTGLMLLSVLITNGLSVYDREVDERRSIILEDFFRLIMTCVKSPLKDVYSAAAQVYGQVLGNDRHRHTLGKDEFRQKFTGYIEDLYKQRKWDRWLTCLNKIGLSHKDFFSFRVMNLVYACLPTVHGPFETAALQVVANFTYTQDHATVDHIRSCMQKVLQGRNIESFAALLWVVWKWLVQFTVKDIVDLVPPIVEAAAHQPARNRQLMYKILMHVYDNRADIRDKPVFDFIRTSLLKGLADDDKKVRNALFQFWDHPGRMEQTSLDERLIAVLTTLYSPNTEQQWLGNAVYFLLNTANKTDDRLMYEFALDDEAVFEPLDVDCSWHKHSVPMTPLFSSQSQSQVEFEDDLKFSFGDSLGAGELRATQARDWTQTMASVSDPSQPVEGLSFGSVGKDMTLFSTMSFNEWSDSVEMGSYSMFRRKIANVPRVGSAKRSRLVSLKPRPRTRGARFTYQGQRNSKKFAILGRDRSKRFYKAFKERQKDAAANQVRMHRKYRVGDLPDIKIKHSSLLLPLQALHNDPIVAKHVFLVLFKGIYAKLGATLDDDARDELRGRVNHAVSRIVGDEGGMEVTHSPLLVNCVLLAAADCIPLGLNIDPWKVGNAAYASQCFHAGAMMLESLMKHRPWESSPGAAKRRKKSREEKNRLKEQEQESHWQLARMYRHLDDQVATLSLYSKFANQPRTRRGIECVLSEDFTRATKIFSELSDDYTRSLDDKRFKWAEGEAPTQREVTVFDDEYMEALQRLARWDELHNNVMEECRAEDGGVDMGVLWKDDGEQWAEQRLQTDYLRFYIQSSLRVKENKSRKQLYDFVNQAMGQPVRRAVLEQQFPHELVQVFALQKNLPRVQYLCKHAFTRILEDWSQLPVLAKESRLNLLQLLQGTLEAEEMGQVLRGEVQAQEVLKSWSWRRPHVSDPIPVWDGILKSRMAFLDAVEDGRVASVVEINACRFDTLLHAARAMTKKRGFDIAETYLNTVQQLGLSTGAREHSFQLRVAQAQLQFSRLDAESRADGDEVRRLTEYSNLRRVLQASLKIAQDEMELHELNDVLGRVWCRMGDLLQVVPNAGDGVSATQAHDHAFDCYKNMASGFDSLLQQNHNDGDTTDTTRTRAADAFLQLGLFCDNRIKEYESNCTTDEEFEEMMELTEIKRYSREMVKSFLHAMRYHSERAVQLFPRVLHLVQHRMDVWPRFKELTAQIPCWMFLRWLPQMLAMLGFAHGDTIMAILLRVARLYPQAVYYPFQLTKEDLATSKEPNAKQWIQQLAFVNNNRGLNQFSECMDCMGSPYMDLVDWMDDTTQAFKTKDKKKAKALFTRLKAHVMTDRKPIIGTKIGDLRRAFVKKYKTAFFALVGKNGEKFLSKQGMTAKKFGDMLANSTISKKNVRDAHNALYSRSKLQLKHHCSFLMDWSEEVSSADEVELPGQYHGFCRPDPTHHLKIVSFKPDSRIMSSIRKPKTMTVQCSDEKEYMYLVKHGEDLRLDQRIEQCFTVMNQLLRGDAQCRTRGLYVHTYDVVPISRRCGILEWVPNVMPIKGVIEDQVSKNNKRDDTAKWPDTRQLTSEYMEWTEDFAANTNNRIRWELIFGVSSSRVVQKMNEMSVAIPNDVLVRAIRELCSSPESFIDIRKRFASTLACYTVCGYILGIGDRHLENFLLKMDTGALVPIDFGMSFGQGITLPVPELTPCRLTPKLVSVLEPLPSADVLKVDMVRTMKALQESKDVLLDVMSVFVQEPHLDWVSEAQKKQPTGSQSQASLSLSSSKPSTSQRSVLQSATVDAAIAWYPRQKIEVARLKLEQFNSVHIMLRELSHTDLKLKGPKTGGNRAFRNAKKFLARAESFVRGKRKPEHDQCTSVEEQIDILVDHATDFNILGRAWVGWASWL